MCLRMINTIKVVREGRLTASLLSQSLLLVAVMFF